MRASPASAPHGRRGRRDHAERHPGAERRLAETARAPVNVDLVTDMAVGPVNPLPARRADERVVVQRRHDRNAGRARKRRQIKGQIEQVVDVNDVGLHRAQHVPQPVAHHRRPVRVFERSADPVVHDLDDRQAVLDSPHHLAVGARRVVIGAQNRDVVAARELAAERQRVNLGPRAVPRQEIVDRVKQPEGHRMRTL